MADFVLKGVRLGFIGAGSMSRALLDGLLGKSLVDAADVVVTNRRNDQALAELRGRYGVSTTRDKAAVSARSDVLVVAVKPADVPQALREMSPFLRRGQMLISVAAGVPTRALEELLPAGMPVVRAMPNTSSRVLESATALCGGRWADERSLVLAEEVFAAVGRVSRVPEELLDAVTAVSGSGPAYVYLLAEAMIRAGMRLGLDPRVARELVVQTVAGAGRMLLETGAEPSELRRQVTSPNGTTAAALRVFEEGGFLGLVEEAVRAAAARARELAEAVRQASSPAQEPDAGRTGTAPGGSPSPERGKAAPGPARAAS